MITSASPNKTYSSPALYNKPKTMPGPATPQKPVDQVKLGQREPQKAGASSSDLAGLASNFAATPEPTKSGLQVEKDATISDQQRKDLEEMNQAYKEKFGKDLRVTSGERKTPEETRKALMENVRDTSDPEKADRMYQGNKAYEGNPDSGDPGLKNIIAQAKTDAASKKSPGQTEEQYVDSQVDQHLKEQTEKGVYLSNHQNGDSVDVATNNTSQNEDGMSADEVAFVKEQARDHGYKVKDEGNHLHLDKAKPGEELRVNTTEPDDIDEYEASSRNVAQRKREVEIANKNGDSGNQRTSWEWLSSGWAAPWRTDKNSGYDPSKAQNQTLPTKKA